MSTKLGRPSLYTEDVAAEILERLAEGESLRSICEDAGMPTRAAVHLWVLADREGFSVRYARARAIQAEVLAEEILDIADTEPDVQRARLKIDAIKWYSSKVAPKRFGDRITQELTGPACVPIQHVLVPQLTKEEWLIAHGIGLPAAGA